MIYCLSSVFAWERLGSAHTSGEAAHLGGRGLLVVGVGGGQQLGMQLV